MAELFINSMDITETEPETCTIDYLPIECIEEILIRVTNNVDRRSCRFVCKLWCELINRDSSSECYVIDGNRIKSNSLYGLPQFRNFLSEFLAYRRKKISLKFVNIDLQDTELYWIQKGPDIVSLSIVNSLYFPIMKIIKYCTRIRKIFFMVYSNADRKNTIRSLERCISEGVNNPSLQILDIYSLALAPHIVFNVKEQKQIVIDLVEKISRTFPRLKEFNLHSKCPLGIVVGLKAFSMAFSNLNFKVTIQDWYDEISFGQSPKMIVSLLKLELNDKYFIDWEVDTLKFISSYDHQNLTWLSLITDIGSSTSISASLLENLISQLPSLKILRVASTNATKFGDNFVKNQLQSLTIWTQRALNDFEIGSEFYNSFKMLKYLSFGQISYTKFPTLIRSLVLLEELHIRCIAANDDGTAAVYEEIVITHEHLKILDIPQHFLVRIAPIKCDLPNLNTLKLNNNRFYGNEKTEADYKQYYKNNPFGDLKRMNCPNLETLLIASSVMLQFDANDYDGYIQWINTVLSFFPKISGFKYSYKTELPRIKTKELTDLVRNYASLESICSCAVLSLPKETKLRIQKLRSQLEMGRKLI